MQYGLLTCHNTENLGDEIQSVAARRFLPRLDRLVERDHLARTRVDDGDLLAVICNGWFTHRPENWPPPVGVVPLLVSVHFADPSIRVGPLGEPVGPFVFADGVVGYLRHWGPVGARDLSTLRQLEQAKVPSYFSGCLTLTLERDPHVGRGEEVVLVDVPGAVVAAVRERTRRDVVLVTHRDPAIVGHEARVRRAEQLLARYQRAHCVVTSRLHAALPSLAYGTPILLVRPESDTERLEGLDVLVHSASEAEFVEGRAAFDIDAPPPNNHDHLRLRDALVERVEDWVRRLEVDEVPEPPPPIGASEREATLWAALAVANEERVRLRAELGATSAELAARREHCANVEASRSWRVATAASRVSAWLRRRVLRRAASGA